MSVKTVSTAPDMADAVAARYVESLRIVGYIPRAQATEATYQALGYKSGLEVHQQLKTSKKLFCRCPAGIFQRGDDFEAELVRHMRPTLSEMGEYDGTALMEKRTRKNIIYRIKDETACTYDIDDTPPFLVNHEALEQALEMALLLNCSIVSELHIARKQYLDGSIPTGFQRTGIVGVGGYIQLTRKRIGITQISIEEDSCREVSDVGHWRTYSTDRLGMPLIESVTDPECLTPDELAEAGQYLRYLARSTGRVRTGLGAARQDVNASIAGGRRVEIKGVAHIPWIPELTHIEAFRQKSLLEIARLLDRRKVNQNVWKIRSRQLDHSLLDHLPYRPSDHAPMEVWAVCLPGFGDILSFFNQPGKTFADEIRGRLKVIACIEFPNFIYDQEAMEPSLRQPLRDARRLFEAGESDAVGLIRAPKEDIPTALETIEERCRIAFEGVPNETRKAFADGTTTFERVLPGPDRMYPDTDSAPVPIDEDLIKKLRSSLPITVDRRKKQLEDWKTPEQMHGFLLRNNLMPVLEELVSTCGLKPTFAVVLLGKSLQSHAGVEANGREHDFSGLVTLCLEIKKRKIYHEVLMELIPVWATSREADIDVLLKMVGYTNKPEFAIIDQISSYKAKFVRNRRTRGDKAMAHWIMGCLRRDALGNLPLSKLWRIVSEATGDE